MHGNEGELPIYTTFSQNNIIHKKNKKLPSFPVGPRQPDVSASCSIPLEY